jgi:hypothetical protein
VTNIEQGNKKFTLVKPARFSSRPVEKQGSIDNPIIETNLLLRNMVSTLESSFGIKCKEVTRKKFMEDFKLTSLSESINAITYQGNVYLITDSVSSKTETEKNAMIIHEFSHLFLAMLKQNDKYNVLYKALMNVDNEKINTAFKAISENKEEAYVNMSIEDMMEEAFCNSLENYIRGNLRIGNDEYFGLSRVITDATIGRVAGDLDEVSGNFKSDISSNVFDVFLSLMANSTSDTNLDSDENILKFNNNIYNNSRQREMKLRTLIENKIIEKECK